MVSLRFGTIFIMMTINQNHKINFALVSRIKGIRFSQLLSDGIEFIPSSEPRLRFTLKPIDSENDADGTWKGHECKLYVSYPATNDQVKFAELYNDHGVMHRVSDEVSLPYEVDKKIYIDKDGRCRENYSPRRNLCPADIQKLLETAETEMVAETVKFLRLLRWRQGIDAPAEIVEHYSLYWTTKDKKYPLAPLSNNEFVAQGSTNLRWENEDCINLHDLWAKEDIAEPLGHTLVREAKTLAPESPRSAILILTTALETAVKMHISDIAPDTAWLLENVPSPPLFRILRDYIPLVHQQIGNNLDYWDAVKPHIKRVQQLVELRNKVAHTGKIPIEAEPIAGYLELVSDLLYLLDVLAGHDWAKSLASYEFCKSLDWPDPIHQRFTILFKAHP